jgi:uncharacterized protein (DUF2141 family)
MSKLILFGGMLLMTAAAAAWAGDSQGNLIVVIDKFKSDSGEVRAALYNSEDGFPGVPKKAYKIAAAKIKNKKAELRFENLPFGVYALGLFHDENSNEKMDLNWMGIPTEGYGISNNVRGVFAPPTFEEAKFNVGAPTTCMTISVLY